MTAAQISESTRRKVSRLISHHRAMGARLFIALWGRVADAVRVLIPVVLPDVGAARRLCAAALVMARCRAAAPVRAVMLFAIGRLGRDDAMSASAGDVRISPAQKRTSGLTFSTSVLCQQRPLDAPHFSGTIARC